MRVESLWPAGVTPVSDIFIDRYMAAANGEFVKTYLLLLRLAGEEGLTVSMLADRLEQTERDVQRGLKYWEKEGLLAAEENEGKITRLLLCYPGEPLPECFRSGKAATPAAEIFTKEDSMQKLKRYTALFLAALAGFFALGVWLRDLRRARSLRWLMGFAALPDIVAGLLKAGMDPEMP